MKQETSIETLDEIADRIAYKYLDRTFGSAKLKSDVLSALRNEREACAKVAEQKATIYRDKMRSQRLRGDENLSEHFHSECNAALEVAAAIRKGDR